MGTYQVPRNVKGEGRILMVFSVKALIYTVVGVGIGFIFKLIFGIVNLDVVGYVFMGVLGLAGFIIGTFKMPDTNTFNITKKTGGEKIDDVIKRAIKFRLHGGKIYVYNKIKTKDASKEEDTDENGRKINGK